MDLINNLMLGFGVALQPINLLYCFIGVFIGTLVGVLPGIGPVAAMSLLLPVTFTSTPEAGIIMLAGIYYGSMYGGSTTAILVNIPGEAASVVTCLDGHEMAQAGSGRTGAGHRRHRLVHRRHAGDPRPDAGGANAGALCREVRPGRVFQPDGAGPLHPHLSVARVAAQGAASWPVSA